MASVGSEGDGGDGGGDEQFVSVTIVIAWAPGCSPRNGNFSVHFSAFVGARGASAFRYSLPGHDGNPHGVKLKSLCLYVRA